MKASSLQLPTNFGCLSQTREVPPLAAQTLLAVNCIGNHGRVESKEMLCTSGGRYTTFPLIHQISLFLDLFEGEVITGSSLTVLLFLWVSKEDLGSASTRIFTYFISANVFAASLFPEAGMNQ